MALTIQKPSTPRPEPTGFRFSNWYEENKSRLSEKRKQKYRNDPAYRAAAKRRSKAQGKKKAQPKIERKHEHSVTFAQMADHLGISAWTLREWRRKGYFPEPHHRDNRLWFTPTQVKVLGRLASFFAKTSSRVKGDDKEVLGAINRWTFANW